MSWIEKGIDMAKQKEEAESMVRKLEKILAEERIKRVDEYAVNPENPQMKIIEASGVIQLIEDVKDAWGGGEVIRRGENGEPRVALRFNFMNMKPRNTMIDGYSEGRRTSTDQYFDDFTEIGIGYYKGGVPQVKVSRNTMTRDSAPSLPVTRPDCLGFFSLYPYSYSGCCYSMDRRIDYTERIPQFRVEKIVDKADFGNVDLTQEIFKKLVLRDFLERERLRILPKHLYPHE